MRNDGNDLGRIAVVGAGAMGSSLAAIAARMAPVVMVVRNTARAAQIFDRGVIVRGKVQADDRPLLVKSVEDLPLIGNVGVIFIATKTTAIPAVCADLAPVIPRLGAGGHRVRLVSYQNGIDPGREIMRLLGYDRVMRMVLNYGAVLDERTGDVEVSMHDPPHAIGCVTPDLVPECQRLAARLTEADFPTEYEPEIEKPVWLKAILNASMSPVAALIDSTIREVLDSPARSVVARLLEESIAVARAEGIAVPDGFAERAWEIFENGADHVPSMVEDIRRGRQSEVGQLNRQIVAHAAAIGVPVPTHETIDTLIEAFDWRLYHARASARRHWSEEAAR